MNSQKRKKLLRKEAVLLKLAEIGEATLDGLLNYLVSGVKDLVSPPSYRELRKRFAGYGQREIFVSTNLKTRVALQTMISRLKKQGLVSKNGINFKITKGGCGFLNKKTEFLLKKYETGKLKRSEDLVLVIFDIAEIEREKRDWLRCQLNLLGFKKLQNSVWVGNVELPKEFLKDIQSLNLTPDVHILTIKKEGTVSGIIEELFN